MHRLTKVCIHCGKTYTYDPSLGDFGLFCKRCGKPQIPLTKGTVKFLAGLVQNIAGRGKERFR